MQYDQTRFLIGLPCVCLVVIMLAGCDREPTSYEKFNQLSQETREQIVADSEAANRKIVEDAYKTIEAFGPKCVASRTDEIVMSEACFHLSHAIKFFACLDGVNEEGEGYNPIGKKTYSSFELTGCRRETQSYMTVSRLSRKMDIEKTNNAVTGQAPHNISTNQAKDFLPQSALRPRFNKVTADNIGTSKTH